MEVLGEEVAAAAEASVDLRNPGSLRRSRRSATRSSNRLPTVTCDEGRKEGREEASEIHQVRKEGRERAGMGGRGGRTRWDSRWTKNN